MDIRKLQRAIVDGLEDVKAQHITVFNTEHLSSMFERVIIASGTSNRQTKALAASVRDSVRGRGMQVLRTEGEDSGEWIIVDCGAAVVHVMQPAIRQYYNLEELWGDKAVKMKLGADADAPRSLPKAESASRRRKAEPATPVKPTLKSSAKSRSKLSAWKAPSRPAPAGQRAPRTRAAAPATGSAAVSVRGPAKRATAKKAPPARKKKA